ncbi:MAG: tRNA nuclease WapA precursor [Firmicutes bacterium ADurb.Bin300]|jgi:RHS repeat-associated protein|nr:MAG: tRNA nuclease WapA precursor [Firmicutes bacterium ADurb.Bin300]HOD01859.1 RHS repeat-associated core domain-containing protein [Clostridiales bacterium]
MRLFYTYDAWGLILSITDANGNEIYDEMHIGKLNPFRYRGYYYDTETGSYYLQSRYYDPGVKRFFNADSQLNPGTGLTGTNMFAYANNNPVMYSDPDGHFILLACIIGGAIIGAVTGALTMAKVSKIETGKVSAKRVAKGTAVGLGIGAVVGTAFGLVGKVVAGYIGVTTAGGGGTTATATANKMTEKMAEVVSKGKTGEALSGLVKNTQRITMPAGNYRIPDGLTNTVLSEVKNYSGTLSYTAQLRDFVSYPQANGLQMYLHTNAALSGPMQQMVDSGTIQLFPLG